MWVLKSHLGLRTSKTSELDNIIFNDSFNLTEIQEKLKILHKDVLLNHHVHILEFLVVVILTSCIVVLDINLEVGWAEHFCSAVTRVLVNCLSFCRY